MSISDFERLLETLIRRDGRTTLTLTETPESADELLRLLERAVVVGNRHCSRRGCCGRRCRLDWLVHPSAQYV